MDNRSVNTLFIVDEASMIPNAGGSNFGSGALLDDLIEFVYSGTGCSLLLLGDSAQLPPVGELESPALSQHYLKGLFLQCYSIEMTHVMRQLDGSGILWNATRLRRLLADDLVFDLPKVKFVGFADVRLLSNSARADLGAVR